MNILFATGGTGGHISAALNLAKGLRSRGDKADIKFVLNDNYNFQKKIKDNGFDFMTYNLKIPSSLLSFSWFIFIGNSIKALIRSFYLIKEFEPDIIISFGSYASVPVVLAGFLSFRNIKIILHEQNVIPGKATKLLSIVSEKIAVSFRESELFLKSKTSYTGNFIDADFFTVTKEKAIEILKLDKDKFTIVVMGGSQGAAAINKLFIKAVSIIETKIRQGIQVIHICGERNYEDVKNEYNLLETIDYHLMGFSDKMPLVLAAGDLVISRAGATSIAEINALGKPAILIPYPYAQNHQMFNADVLKKNGAALVYDEKMISASILADAITELIKDKKQLQIMGQASRNLADSDSICKMKQVINQIYENSR
jgi:UDP-N-acetylglucosamine--N-acetylmuramyl-(pentapeptide) pyrophosphoryl-undecaprenol N-acetylglucosamine transferase